MHRSVFRPRRWLSAFMIMMALAMLPLPANSFIPAAEALIVSIPPALAPSSSICPSSATPTLVDLEPYLGSWATARVLFEGAVCYRYYIEQEPGTKGQVRVTLSSAQPGIIILPLAGLGVSCSWPNCGNARLHEGGSLQWTSPEFSHDWRYVARANHYVDVYAAGFGSFTVEATYGAMQLPGDRNFKNAAAWRPEAVPASDAKLPFTGDWDHTLYNDPSSLGQDSCGAAENQRDGVGLLGTGEAGGVPALAQVVPLGVPELTTGQGPAEGPVTAGPAAVGAQHHVRLGQRGVYINGRIAYANSPATSSMCPAVASDAEDWYAFTVQPGAQVAVNVWPTRYDFYGGDFHTQFFRAVPVVGGTNYANGSVVTDP